MKPYLIVCTLILVAALPMGSLLSQIDNNKDFIVTTQQPIDDIEVVLAGPAPPPLSQIYNGHPGGFSFQNFALFPDGQGNWVLHWSVPLFQGGPVPWIPPMSQIHLGFSIEDTIYTMLRWCFTFQGIPIGTAVQVYAYSPPERRGNLVVLNILDNLCGGEAHPLQYFIGNVFVEYFDARQPLPTLNDMTPRTFLRRDTVTIPPIVLPRMSQQEFFLPTPPDSTRFVLWIFDIDVNPSLLQWRSRDFKQFALPPGSIEGYKFHDHNGNGLRDPEDEGLGGWYISINGTVDTTLLTDVDGRYYVGNLPVGHYTITEDNQTGWVQSVPVNPNSYSVFLGVGEDATGLNFGNTLESKITGTKYEDVDGDGVLDDEDLPLKGWVIVLYDSLHQQYYYDTTDTNGSFEFSNLLPGYYRKWEIEQPGWVPTYPPGIGTGILLWFPHEDTMDIEIILNFEQICVSGVKYYDRNMNGVRDEGEEGLAGWSIYLEGVGSVATDTSGYYEFCNVDPGSYNLAEFQLDGWRRTQPPDPGTYRIHPLSGRDTTHLDFGNLREGDTLMFRTFECAAFESVSCEKIKPAKPPKSGKPITTPPNLVNLMKLVNVVIVGVPNSEKKGPPYLETKSYKDAMKTFCDKGVMHTKGPRGFDYDMKYKLLRGRYKSISPNKKQNNHLLQELLTLQFNLLASEKGITQTGLGSLIYKEAGNPLSGMSINAIADSGDRIMTYWGGPWIYPPVSYTTYILYDTVVSKLNAAFSCAWAFDSSSWKLGTLKIPGCWAIAYVPYLTTGPAMAPRNRYRNVAESAPSVYALEQNYPNPFNPLTTIAFELAEPSLVTLSVYDVLGREVVRLVDRAEYEEGIDEVDFDASSLTSGVYFFRLTVQNSDNQAVVFTQVRKMMLVK